MIHSWSRIERLFHEALTRPPEERGPFLDRECEGDLSLRRAVEALLDSDSRASGFLSTPVVVRPASGPGLAVGALIPGDPASREAIHSRVQRPFEFTADAVIGGYRIVRPLGRGGMGEVYEAEDLTLGRHVAIKLLKDLSDSAAARQRLLGEARTASSLNHPHIVTIHSIDRDRDGRDFLVMEYVEGSTLRERLASGALEVDELLTMAGQVADALAAAHARGIVHRDLKPENVMLTASGQVKLLDFGIAVQTRPQTDLEPPRKAQPVVGSLNYMSPEQAAGKQTNFRSDQFSFGSILYEAASGARPFDGSNAGEILSALRRADPLRLAERCPGMPDPLRWVIERCLAWDPADRYASTEDLHRELTMLRTRLFDVKVRDDVPPVPMPRTSLVGRGDELARAKALLLDERVPLLTLTGPAGVGKTRLALELAATLSGRFGNRIFFVDLSRVASPDPVAETIAAALGMRDTVGIDMAAALRRWVRERQHWPILLLIDNFEHVLAAAPLVGELLTAARSLTVLATSRTALRLAGEHELIVPPLALPGTRATNVKDISNSPAVTLFVQRATAAKSDFALIADNAVSIARICERLDGLPLAIELAAARVRQLSPDAILSKLEHRLDLLTCGPRDAPARQRTLRAAIEWSHELLEERELILFRRLSVFSGGCTLEGIEAVCNTRRDVGENLEDLLNGLVEKSMVFRTTNLGDQLRVTQLETIREYAKERLDATADGDLARRAHAAYCLVLAEEGFGLRGRQQSDWMTRCELEYSNHRAALEWLIGRQQFEWGVRLASALMPFWHARAFLTEGREWLRRLLALPREGQPLAWRALALRHSAYLRQQQGDLSTGWRRLFDESRAIFSELGDRWNVAEASSNYGIVLAQLGRHDAARAEMETSLALWRELRDERGEARALGNLATLAKVAGDHVRARQLCQQSRELFEKTGDVEAIAWSFNHEADAARWAGDFLAAQRLLELALERFRDAGDDLGSATCLADLATIHVDEDPSAAGRCGLEALRMLVTAGHTRGVARVLETLARVAWRQGGPERALRLAGAAAAVRRGFDRLDRLELRHPGDVEGLHRMIAESRHHTGGNAATFWMQGWSSPLQATVEYALGRESG